MKNQMQPTTNVRKTEGRPDPVLQVEVWKDKVYEETKSMTREELMQYYREGVEMVETARQISRKAV